MSQKIISSRSTIFLAGITARTSNHAEMNPETAQIGATLYKYISNNLAEKIPNRKKPGITYCVYTEYESDHTGPYTYFVGEEVPCESELLPDGSRTNICYLYH